METRPPSPPRQRPASRKKAGYALFALSGVLALGFAMVWNPPTAKVHSFSAVSDYDPVKESGCTNSGQGCHGEDRDYADFNAYHPDAKCTRCHDYQGVGCIPCHSPKASECVECHDGSREGVSDCVRLSDPYPRGHYGETTHTATGTDFDQEVRTAAEGEAAATCGQCHSRDLLEAHTGVPVVPGSEYGPDVGCGECHNDVRSRGLAEVLSDWKGRRCEDCHAIGTSSPMHGAEVAGSVEATGSEGCAASGPGCHDSEDLHAAHPDAPESCSGSAADGEPGCHDFEVESHQPTARSCGSADAGACHGSREPGTFSHEHDREVHSPETDGPSADASSFGIPCGRCHVMAPDGRSLVDEHARPTSAKSTAPDDVCRNCHNHPASLEAVADDWELRDSQRSCEACHGREGLDAAHTGDMAALHAAERSDGCADTGPGCHPTGALNDIGSPRVDGGLHEGCLRCHDRTSSGGNRSYDPGAKSCGQGRDCHDAAGAYDPKRSVHDGAGGRADGSDDSHHRAGRRQRDARYRDPETGVSTACGACHSMRLGVEHARPNTGFPAGGTCRWCHNRNLASASVVKGDWSARSTSRACAACHDGTAAAAPHGRVDSVHGGIELRLDGTPEKGACVRSGCHDTAALRRVHERFGCTVRGCHASSGDIRGRGVTGCGGMDAATSCHSGYSALTGHKDVDAIHAAVERAPDGVVEKGACAVSGCHPYTDVRELHAEKGCVIAGCHDAGATRLMSCGGSDGAEGCHAGYWARNHFVDHSADRTGVVDGVTYGPGGNEGCFGCHQTSLIYEHMRQLAGGTLEGGGVNHCRVCHYNADDPGTGRYAGLPAVRAAIAGSDARCVACHASGTAVDGPGAVASPHKQVSSVDPLPSGKVWADPLSEWRAALSGPTGGGHNVLPGALAGVPDTKSFPLSEFVVNGSAYVWALPPNSGSTTWLRPEPFAPDAVSSPESIRGITIRCDDCHLMPEEARGPQGATVRVYIDPEYSQTEYANPTTEAHQFYATGTERVVCFKCHPIQAGDGLVPGGHSLHGRHATYRGHPYDAPDPRHWGAKCIDCHVRIPHAWKRPRLLARTVETTDGVEPDEYPYVREGHDGLVGIVLRSFNSHADLRSGSCATGGCYENHTPARHPEPQDIPDAEYWP
ncbi:MAG: hypothetical protein IBX62_03370 [Coriobacteriia bacterium]|nr:hypothetical protein [Coriobacteriia bacterium]